jgi:hypothetical protein
MLFAVTALVVALAVGVFLWNNLPDAYPAAVRNEYLAGKITLEEAVNKVGIQAYDWVKYKKRLERRMAEYQNDG